MSTVISPHRSRLAPLALVALLIGACTSTAASPSAATTPAPSTAVVTAAPSTASPTPVPEFPATLTDDEGTAVEIAAEPQKIVSLTPANTEILFALGAGDRVVATDDGSDYPTEAAALPDVATFATVDVEKVVEPRTPTSSSPAASASRRPTRSRSSRSLGVPVLVVYAPTVDGVYKDIELIGAATGAGGRGHRAHRRHAFRDDDDRRRRHGGGGRGRHQAARLLRRRLLDDDRRRSTVRPRARSSPRWSALAGVDDHHRRPGDVRDPARDADREGPRRSSSLGVNAVLQRRRPRSSRSATGWEVLTAVKNGDIRPVNDTEITRPGPRLATRPAEPRPGDLPRPRHPAGAIGTGVSVSAVSATIRSGGSRRPDPGAAGR